MKCDHKRMRYWAVPIVAAAMFALAPRRLKRATPRN